MNILKNKILLALLILSPAAYAVDGGMNGGGGCTIQTPGSSPQLLDFAVHNVGAVQSQPGVRLQISETAQALGIDSLQPDQQTQLRSLQNFIQQRLNLWIADSPGAINALRATVADFPFFITPYRFNLDTSSCPTRGINGHVAMAVAYHQGMGALISVPAFNSLNFISQAGLILHEALRLLQVDGNHNLTDLQIQDFTYRILLTAPNSQSLDLSFSERISARRDDVNSVIMRTEELCREASAQAPNECRSIQSANSVRATLHALLNMAEDNYDLANEAGSKNFWRSFVRRVQGTIDLDVNIKLTESSDRYAAINVATPHILSSILLQQSFAHASSAEKARLRRQFAEVWQPLLHAGIVF